MPSINLQNKIRWEEIIVNTTDYLSETIEEVKVGELLVEDEADPPAMQLLSNRNMDSCC